jgi:hypothetical protein
MYFDYSSAQFRYEPFPIALARPIMKESLYKEFVDNFPPTDIFESFEAMGKRGRKFTLSEKENPKVYNDFVQNSPVWREFHRWIKSDDFCYGALAMLKEHFIDLGFKQKEPMSRYVSNLSAAVRGKFASRDIIPLRARFEFSALPSDGGSLPPHTDAPSKIVTMVVSMVKDGEWNPAFGGGTDVNQPKKIEHAYNQVNRLADFSDMDVAHTYEFTPNQAVIFVKTYNSWHSVRPMTGNDPTLLRRTLTVNIEAGR